MDTLVGCEDLRKSFGPLTAVDGISLDVKRGEVLGFLGPNGAGKSTTMKMLTGFLEPDGGSARVAGYDVQTDPLPAKMRLGYLPEGAPAYAEMTPLRFLTFVAEIRGYEGGEIARRVGSAAEKIGLREVLHQSIETLSKGYKRRVGLAQAILHDPEVLVMDEPTDGLDPNQKHQVRQLIANMARDKAIIISTHILEEVEAVCTRAVIISKGRIVADGTADELIALAPDHGAVIIRAAPETLVAVERAVLSLPETDRIEFMERTGAMQEMRVHGKPGADVGARVSDLLRQQNIATEDVRIGRGRLEDVFRRLTTSDEMSAREPPADE